jgi:L-threonylcarbamoyladenylate synthase
MPTRLIVSTERPDPELIARAARLVRAGGIVAFPTDTLYGLAVDPGNETAVERLFDVKGRDASLALPLVAADLEQVRVWSGALPDLVATLARRFWPGPLTLVLPAAPALPARLLGGGHTVAIRVPAHAVARALAHAVGRPVTSTSANRSGWPPPATADAVEQALGSAIDLVIDAGPCPGGPPSTIVDVAGTTPRLLRAGAVPWERVLESLRA